MEDIAGVRERADERDEMDRRCHWSLPEALGEALQMHLSFVKRATLWVGVKLVFIVVVAKTGFSRLKISPAHPRVSETSVRGCSVRRCATGVHVEHKNGTVHTVEN